MQKYLILFLIFLCSICNVNAQGQYDVKLIPVELLLNANVVKRSEEIKIDIKNIGKAYIHTKYALTILNPSGDRFANFFEQYDKLRSVYDIEGTLYDATGKKVKSLKNKDVQDISGTTGFAEVSDDRSKIHNFNCTNYPYTIEYESTTELKGIFYLPNWLPLENERFSVEESKLVVQTPLDYKLRFKSFNVKKEALVSTIKQTIQYEWAVEKLTAIISEAFQPDWYKITPAVFLAPTDFEIQNYNGNMSDWKNYGKFSYLLNVGRDKLPDNIKQKVHALTDHISTDKEKTKILYEYLQQNSHYVSIQLGIGGWQTFDANYVASKGYGDCKALSNYMYSILKEVGIKSFYTIIKAGENKQAILADFPSTQFNHIIVCVPQANDSIWLECTSQTLPMGYLSGFTSNRKALLVYETGGTLVNTPIYKKTDNLETRKIMGEVDEQGKLMAMISTTYKAQKQDHLHSMLETISKEKIKEVLNEQLNLSSYDIAKFDYIEEKTQLPVIHETIELSANNYCTVTGKRLFINPNILNKSSSKISSPLDRKFDINVTNEFIEIDSVEILLPTGYAVESIPENINVTTKFGSYITSIKMETNKLIYSRKLERNRGIYPSKDAVELSNFLSKIYNSDRAKLVFVKNN